MPHWSNKCPQNQDDTDIYLHAVAFDIGCRSKFSHIFIFAYKIERLLLSRTGSKERSEVKKLGKFLATLVATVAIFGLTNTCADAVSKPRNPGLQLPKPPAKLGTGMGGRLAKQVKAAATKAKRQVDARSKRR